jgi:hypothetical protein
MSEENLDGGDEFRAARKAERREQKREKAKDAPVVARYGVWTGEGYLREGEGLERRLAEQSVKPPSGRREKRRKRKKK